MKTKHIFIAMLVLIGFTCQAQQVTRREAIKAAINTMKYLGQHEATQNNIKDVYTIEQNNHTLLYEVCFKSGETILLSGHKAMQPILGYITNGNGETILNQYDQIPDGLRDFIDEYATYSEYCFENNIVSEQKRTAWQSLQNYERNKSIRRMVGPLTTTAWGQSYTTLEYVIQNVYNNLFYRPVSHAYNRMIFEECIPCIDYHGNKYSVSGCPSVAMAQIMFYWKYPVYDENNIPMYNWNNMKNMNIDDIASFVQTVNEGHEKQYQFQKSIDAIAKLIRDCALESNTDFCFPFHNYCQSASGPLRTVEAFKAFNYSHAELKLKIFHLRRWKDMLRDELDAGRPICYASASSDINLEWNAHMYVCDGYNDDDTFSFNWGWNGEYNGNFFTLDSLPDDMTFVHCAIFNIYPDDTQDINDFVPFNQSLYSFYLEHPNELPYHITPFYYSDLKSVTKAQDPTGNYRTIPADAEAYYTAHNTITLRDGFHAEEGSCFYAYIAKVNNNNRNTKDTESPQPTKTHTTPSITENKLMVYPNPSSSIFSITLLNNDTKIKQITIHNLIGNMILSEQNPQNDYFDISSYPNGIYIIKVITNQNEILYSKLIKN